LDLEFPRHCVPNRRRALIATVFLRATQFEGLPFSADSTMSIGSRKSLRERVCTFCGTQGNILRRYGIAPAPKRSQTTTWKQFLATHMAVLAGSDFFTVEVLTWRGLATYYVLFFLHLETRRVTLGGITRHPTETWMEQVARNAIDEASGHLHHIRYVLHDRDTKFCASFRTTLTSGEMHCAPGTESGFKRICGALGAIGKGRMFVQADPVWRTCPAAGHC
jgi:hypothetical protein